MAWEGPNLHFGHIDEARRRDDALALKTLDGRVRMTGLKGELPQLWVTSTPKKHWLFDYYGPLVIDPETGLSIDPRNPEQQDPFESFKRDVRLLKLRTEDNEVNTFAGFAAKRRQSLTEDEARILLEAEWEDPADTSRFLESIILWDQCKEDNLAASSRFTPMVAAADAGVSNDCFAFLAVSRHPVHKQNLAVRHTKVWVPKGGRKLEFQEIEDYIYDFCKANSVVELCYDPFQLHFMQQRLTARRAVYCYEFSQGSDRLEADKGLLDLIRARRIAHSGEQDLRAHLDNANRRLAAEEKKLRIVKRMPSQKIDLAVSLSMAAYRCLALNL
jgi:phage terminase large subunit-like protein